MKSLILSKKTKQSDNIVCAICKKGIYIPLNPNSNVNRSFICNKCGSRVNIDDSTICIE